MFPVDRPTTTTLDDLAITVIEGNEAFIGSEGDNLPVVVNWDVIVLTGSVGRFNKGIWVVQDDAPTTSQFKAVKLGSTPVTDGDIEAGAKVQRGGRFYLHAGDRVAADAAVADPDEIVFLELKDTEIVRPPPPPEIAD